MYDIQIQIEDIEPLTGINIIEKTKYYISLYKKKID